MQKWAYEIHSTFLVPGAPLRIPGLEQSSVVNDIDRWEKEWLFISPGTLTGKFNQFLPPFLQQDEVSALFKGWIISNDNKACLKSPLERCQI